MTVKFKTILAVYPLSPTLFYVSNLLKTCVSANASYLLNNLHVSNFASSNPRFIPLYIPTLVLLYMLQLLAFVSCSYYPSYNHFMKPDFFKPILILRTTKHEEEDIKKDKEKGFWNKFDFDFSQVGVVKVLICLLIVCVSVLIGYQIRKSEEQNNYVRLPAA